MKFVIVEVPTHKHITYQPPWPKELEWVRAQLKRGGTPRFIVVRDYRILLNTTSAKGWKNRALPLIKKLIAKPGYNKPLAVEQEEELERRDGN